MPAEQIFVCTGAAHRDAVLANLPELPKDNLLGEPMGRDTANAVGFPAAILHKRDKDAVLAVDNADHVIEPVDSFSSRYQNRIRCHREIAECAGDLRHRPHARPHRPGLHPPRRSARGFQRRLQRAGVQRKARQADRRPLRRIRPLLLEQRHVRLACDTVLNELATHLPEAHKGLMQIADAWDTPQHEKVLNEAYPKLPKISVDYAIMEPASQGKGKAQVVVVEMPVQWLDVGSWPALAETLETDEHDNAIVGT